MIGTVICRNCDTAIEVSDGDVTRFRANPVFTCSVCQHDLSQRMAELIGRGEDDPSEEPTVADDEAYDGLPVGESLDQAAERIRASRSPEPTQVTRNPEPTPVMRNPEPTPIMTAPPGGAVATEAEDPAMLALRIAQQAQAQAQALVAQAMAQVEPDEDGSTGVVAIPNWRGAGAAAVAVAVPPDAAATAPGAPDLAVSARVGVVPEEPENEPTRKRKGEKTESTGPGDKQAESMPLMAAQRVELESEEETISHENPPGALPESPANEMTPSISSRGPLVPHEPPHEVTIRKQGAPPPLPAKTSLPARTGTGPTGIGALGIRVNTMNRAVVRPSSNGRPVALPSPAAETQISGLHTIAPDRPSGSAATPSAPWAATTPAQRGKKPGALSAIPKWAFFAVGGGIAAVAGAFVLVNMTNTGRPVATPLPTPSIDATPDGTFVTETQVPVQTGALPKSTPTTTAVAATSPVRSATPDPTPAASLAARTPAPTATITVVPRTTPTAVAIATVRTTPAPTPTAKPTARRSSEVDAVIEGATKKAARGQDQMAMTDLMKAMKANPTSEELHYRAWQLARIYSPAVHGEAFGRSYLEKFGASNPQNKANIEEWLATRPPSP